MNLRWKKTLATGLATLTLTLGTAMPAAADVDPKNVEALVKAYTELVNQHYSHPDQEKLLEAALQGMTDAVKDRFTQYMTPAEFQEFVHALDMSYAGIGAVIANQDGQAIIAQVYSGSPAAGVGLKVGDVILAVDGTPVAGQAPGEVGAKVRGTPGTTVVIKISRGGSELTYLISRAELELPSVVSRDLGDGIAYIGIGSFGHDTATQFAGALAQVEESHAKGLVLDLRGNGGGYVQAALEIADSLMTQGTILIIHDGDQEIPIVADDAGTEIPLVVLVDEDSASASEMLGGALQKNGRARLVGHTTYGKGTMQAPVELANGGVLKLSIDRWELADHTSPDRVGLTPDLPIDNLALTPSVAKELLLPLEKRTLRLSRQKAELGVAGETLPLAATPVAARDGRTYLPLRLVMEGLGYAVSWQPALQAATVQVGAHTLKVELATGTLWVDGQRSERAGAIRLIDGSAYIDAQALGAVPGFAVEMDEQAVTVRTR